MVVTQLSEQRVRTLAADFIGADVRPVADVVEAVLDRADVAVGDDADALDAAGFVEDVLLDHGEFFEIDPVDDDDALVGYLPDRLIGVTLTARVEADDAAHDRLPADGVSVLTWAVMDRPLRLVDDAGGESGEVALEELEVGGVGDRAGLWGDFFVGPAGWLGAGEGFVEFTIGPAWTSTVTRVDTDVPAGSDLCDAFARSFDRVLQSPLADDLPDFTTLDEVALDMVGREIEVLRRVRMPTLPALAEVAGFEVHGALVARPGFDWPELRRWQAEQRAARLWDLDDEDAQLLALVDSASVVAIAAHESGVPTVELFGDDHADALDAFAIALERSRVAKAFLSEHLGRGTDPEALLAWVVEILDAAPGGIDGFGGARWVAARCLDMLGRPVEAEAMLLDATRRFDPPDALAMLARFAADRGDAPGAIRLLQRTDIFDVDDPAELDDDPFLSEIAPFAAQRPRAAAGRNDLCPCGSGKKYKRCHLGTERHSIDDRAGWLHLKMMRFVHDNRFLGDHAELAAIAFSASGEHTFSYADLLELPLIVDLTLALSGAGSAFADERDSFLPDDEALLAAQWSLVEPSVFEVVEIDEDHLELTDLRSGERLTVVNITPHASTAPGALMFGRPLPVGDGWRALPGFVQVTVHGLPNWLAAIDEVDVEAIAALIGASFAPPSLSNTDGEVLRFHTQTWHIPNNADLGQLLSPFGLQDDGLADSAEEETTRYSLVRDTANQADTVIASMRLVGETLDVDCNSDQRAQEVSQIIIDNVPGARLLDQDWFESSEMFGRAEPGEELAASSAGSFDENDPEIVDLIAAQVARYETAWLDDEIPALGGRTPRECAADPIGRESLVRLLASFPETDSPTEMSPSRLRAALGL